MRNDKYKINKVSVALTTYNGERFLREQLDSLYKQTKLPDEVVVCDDNSSDDTISILEEYHKKYGLKFYQNSSSLGVNANFFQAISLCNGDYICICDQDDIWKKNKIETLFNAIEEIKEKDVPFAVSSLRQDIDAEGKPIAMPQSFPEGIHWTNTLMNTEQSQGCTMIINRPLAELSLKFYREKPQSNDVMYDVLISVLAAIFGKKRNLSIDLMLYRHHNSNVVDKFRKGKKSFWEKVQEMPTYYPFLLDYRIRELSIIYQLVEGETLPPDIEIFLKKMNDLHKTETIYKGLPIVLSLSQLSWVRKCKILILTPIAKTLKIINQKR